VERLSDFYRRAHPPGFWDPVARALGEGANAPHKRFRRHGAACVLGSLSLFSLLTGVGSLLAQSPPPTWFPWRTVWIALNLGLGLALVPVWWRLGFHGGHDEHASAV
jgi:hypothetical protein